MDKKHKYMNELAVNWWAKYFTNPEYELVRPDIEDMEPPISRLLHSDTIPEIIITTDKIAAFKEYLIEDSRMHALKKTECTFMTTWKPIGELAKACAHANLSTKCFPTGVTMTIDYIKGTIILDIEGKVSTLYPPCKKPIRD